MPVYEFSAHTYCYNLTDKKALAILGFIEMPASRAEIEKAVPVLLPRKHPDKDNSAGSTARTQAVLAARAQLAKHFRDRYHGV